ncbi:MAG TPA: glycine cleavage system protein GcvH [Chthonomonadales bacterium]|nr:glycine cleavage system protein GcvH [Chthonomonadales bacterium]
MSIPSDLKYTKTHEWVRVNGDIATIGITDYAQSELGDIVFLELPEAGRILAQDEVFGTVESVKAVSDLYSPVSGEVVEVNHAIVDATETVNEDPYGSGWMIRVRMSNPAELEELLSDRDYEREIEGESEQ